MSELFGGAFKNTMLCSLSKPLESESQWQGLGVVYFLELSQKILELPRLGTMELNKPVQIHIIRRSLADFPGHSSKKKKRRRRKRILLLCHLPYIYP